VRAARVDTQPGLARADFSPHGHAEGLSDLYASVLGGSYQSKLTLAIAQKIEESLIADGWPVGRVLGNRKTLTNEYGVGRDVLREVFRVLEARNDARALRGRYGGLEVVDPSEDHMYAMLNGYAYISMLDRREAIAAWITLNTVAARLLAANDPAVGVTIQRLLAANTHASSFDYREFCRALIRSTGSQLLTHLSDCVLSLLSPASRIPLDAAPSKLLTTKELDALSAARFVRALRHMLFNAEVEILRNEPLHSRQFPAPKEPALGTTHSPPMQVVRHLMSKIAPDEWARGYLLGNEMELSERLGFDRSVIRQAIRIMEDAETATAIEGRGRGLITRTPSPGPLSRRLCTLFVSRRIRPTDAEAVFDALKIELAELAARRATAEDLSALEELTVELPRLESGVLVAAVQRFERAQHRAVHNPLLCMFVDAIKAFLSWGMTQELHAPPQVIVIYKEHTLRVFSAIRARDPIAAADLECAKLAALRKCREQVLQNFEIGPSAVNGGTKGPRRRCADQ
jgi:DNA-binding FadR family transcriptional regulator